MRFYIDEASGEVFVYENGDDDVKNEDGSYLWRKSGLVPCEPLPDQYHTWDALSKSWKLTLTDKKSADEQSRLSGAVQSHLDAAAQSKGYDNIVSACSYAAAPNLFQAESIAFLEWRANVWSYCHGVLSAVQSGARAIPDAATLISELPALVLPA